MMMSNYLLVIALFLFRLCCTVTSAEVCPAASYVRLRFEDVEPFYIPLAVFGQQDPFTGASTAEPATLALALPRDACSAGPVLTSPTILLADRGNCTFLEKAQHAAAANATGLILINNSTACLYPGLDEGDHDAANTLTQTFVAAADNSTGLELRQMLAGAQTAAVVTGFTSWTVHKVDVASGLLIVFALVTIAVGAVWSGRTFSEHLGHRSETAPPAPDDGEAGDASSGGVLAEHFSLTLPAVAAFVTIASCMMFLLFFLLNRYVFYAFLVLFSYGSCVATATCTHAAISASVPALSVKFFSVPKPKLCVSYSAFIASTAAVALVLTWLLNRHTLWAWIPQNALGIFFMVFILQTISLPDLKVATAFMASLFCYDIFMVFITPLFMPHGDSVMVKVARGGSANEVMPMLLIVPRLAPPIHSAMMLGYGDVVVPGLLIVLLRRFDVATGRPLLYSYMLASLVAYTAGLVLTGVALEFSWFGSQGQPALLYLVPTTLAVTWALAGWRGDTAALWTGRVEDWKDHASGSEEADVERGEGLLARRAARRGGGTAQSAERDDGTQAQQSAEPAELLVEC